MITGKMKSNLNKGKNNMRYEQKAELQDSNKARMYEEKKMEKKEMKEYKEGLEVMTTNELVNIIIEQDKRLTSYEEKERHDYKQGKGE